MLNKALKWFDNFIKPSAARSQTDVSAFVPVLKNSKNSFEEL